MCAETIKNIIAEIPPGDDNDYLRLKAKLLALNSNYKEAFETVENKDVKDICRCKSNYIFAFRHHTMSA